MAYASMLTNIANDLDQLLTDLRHTQPPGHSAPGMGVGVEGHTLNTLTQHSGDTLGKDSFLSSAETASRRLGDTIGSSQSLVSSSGSDNLSVDSGHDERTQGTTSPLVFDPNHFGGSKPKSLDNTATIATMTQSFPPPPSHSSHDNNDSKSSTDLRPINLVERLAKTHTIWLLTQMSRAGAVHLLKDRETGVFIIRKSSQTMSLALSVQNRLNDRANVDHYLIEASDYGMRLQGSAHFFHSIPSLIAHYIEHLDELPYRLTLPVAILQARSSRELASLAMLGQDFWLSPVSRKSLAPSPVCGSLHKSCSEPIDIRQPLQTSLAQHTPNTPPLHTVPSHSVSDFSDFLSSQQEQQQVFKEHFNAQILPPSHPSPSNPRTIVASPPSKAHVGFGPHLLRLRDLNNTPTSTDSSGAEEGGQSSLPRGHLVGTLSQSGGISDASSQTDFSSLKEHQSKSKPNLYSMTPVELLHLPENSYFRSSLSDKMSDYEDIWRSSYDTDSVRNGSVKGVATGYEVGSCVTARSDFSKFFAISSNRGSSEGTQVSVVVTTASSDVPPVLTLSSVPPPPPSTDKSSINPKLLTPVTRLTRLKSSSESSLATLGSPVYAEPADAVVFREKQVQSSRRVRRRSAPSVSSQSVPKERLQPSKSSKQSKQSSQTVSKPHAFFSSSTKDQTENTQAKKANVQPKPAVSAIPKKQRGSGMTRSQSMRTPQEVAKLSQKKPGWQERFNRLKLGTKVLSHSGSPYAATTQGTKPQLDESLFVVEENPAARDVAGNAPKVSKFPVYQKSRPVQANNRSSVFSESSTVQDIISCAMPELMVRPIQTQHLTVHSGKPLSEYDNFNPYAPPSASSHGTIFCTPWEGGMADTLMRSTKAQLPPAMNLQERVQKWQEANQTFQQHQQQQQPLTKESFQQQQQQATKESFQQQQQQATKEALRQQQLQVGVVKPVPSPQISHAAQILSSANSANTNTTNTLNVQGQIVAKPRQQPSHSHKAASPSQPRPQSMLYQPSDPSHGKQVLTRSFSNPNQPQVAAQQPSHCQSHQHHHQQQHHHHHSHHQHHHHHHHQHHNHQHSQGQQTSVQSSPVLQDSQSRGLMSNCPDVINCHHVAVDTGHSAVSDDEVWALSVPSTLQQRGQQASRHKQTRQSPGNKIRDYIFKLSQDHSTTFGSTIENFIQCTVESQERTPHHVMRNVRQFMTGIKNYLVKHGEGQLEDLIETERNKLGTNEILNIDALIETTLHMCVLRPLKHHIYRLFVDFHGRNNSLELMSRNIKYARTKTAEEIGIKPGLIPPQSSDMETIKHYLDKMQRAYSPLKKLENLLNATSAIYSCVKVQGKKHMNSRGPASLGADDFLPLLIYVLVHCGLVSAEIEADYMWGLLHPSVLTGEGGYYLTTLSSAVLILKNFQEAHESKTASLEGHLPTLGEVQGFLKIAFPDELRDTILWKTLPVRPNMTTKDVCAMIAHKFKITNPQDYGLILLCNGEESQLGDNQCPQILKKDNLAAGKESFFAYKRLGANIAWPSSIKYT